MSWSDSVVVAARRRRRSLAPIVVYVIDGDQVAAAAARGARVSLRLLTLAVVLGHPIPALAASTGAAVTTVANLDRLMTVVDILRKIGKYVAIGSLMFSGIMWMGGHRTEATERAVGTAIGYLLVNHAADIIDFLDGI